MLWIPFSPVVVGEGTKLQSHSSALRPEWIECIRHLIQKERLMLRAALTFLFVIGGLAHSTTAGARDAAVVADDATPPLVIKFYDITLLTAVPPQFPFEDGTRKRGATTHQLSGGGGQGGGGGFSGGGQGGGGGFGGGGGGGFSLPMEPIQIGGGGFGGGTGPSLSTQSTERGLQQQLEERGESLADLIVRHVATDSWQDSGEGPGEITDLVNTLIIRQTEAIHKQVGEFLKSLTTASIGSGTYQVEAWWLPASGGDPSELRNLLSGKLEESIVLEQLTSLCQNDGGYHGRLLCQERVTTHIASGRKVPVITGSTPVVGTGSIGYSPQVSTLHLGLMLETRLTSIPEYMLSASDTKNSEQVEMSFRSQVTSSDVQIQERATFEKVDRYVLGEHGVAGACRINVGTPTLVASLTQMSKQEKQESETPPELQLVIRVTRVNE